MGEINITICTVNYNSSEFIGNMLYALKKLTSNSYKVIIRDNNSKLSDYNNLVNIIKTNNYKNIELYRFETDLIGSMAHGDALNEMVGRINTKYGVILDADAVFLAKDWDNVLISGLSEKQPIIGTQADISSGKPEDFPLMFALFFVVDIFREMNVDFRPKNISRLQDTGWELRDKYLSSGLSGGLLYSFSTRQYREGPFKTVICTEYYLSQNGGGGIFAAHFGRGSAPTAKRLIRFGLGENIVNKIINKSLRYVSAVKWTIDRKKWLRICRQIVDDKEYE